MIALADTLAENPFDQAYKLRMVNRIEEKVCRELTLETFEPAVIPVQASVSASTEIDDDTGDETEEPGGNESDSETRSGNGTVTRSGAGEQEEEETEPRVNLYLSGPTAEGMYLAWMKTQLYWAMGEYETYENEKAMFEYEWSELAAYICQKRHEGSCGREYT